MDNHKFQELVIQQLKTLAEGQQTIEARMGGMETRMGGMETRMGGMETRMGGIETRISGIETRMGGMETRISGIETRMDNFEAVQRRIENRMENEVIEKIRALFDDRSVHLDYFVSIKNSLARVEDRVEFLARQNLEHLLKLQEHDREIRLLRLEKSEGAI